MFTYEEIEDLIRIDCDVFDQKSTDKENKDKNKAYGDKASNASTQRYPKVHEREETVFKDTVDYIMDGLEDIGLDELIDVLGSSKYY